MFVLNYSIPELKEMIEGIDRDISRESNTEERELLKAIKIALIEQLDYWDE